MTSHLLRAAFIGLALFATAVGPVVEAQRGARGGGARAGGGGQNLQVRRSANGSVNHNANANINRNANVNRNTNINRNANVNVNRNVNVDVHGGYYRDYDDFHPFAVAAVAATTAIVIGSIVRSLPPSCSNVIVGGVTFYQCGSSWYQPQYVGTSVQYVVVAAPR